MRAIIELQTWDAANDSLTEPTTVAAVDLDAGHNVVAVMFGDVDVNMQRAIGVFMRDAENPTVYGTWFAGTDAGEIYTVVPAPR